MPVPRTPPGKTDTLDEAASASGPGRSRPSPPRSSPDDGARRPPHDRGTRGRLHPSPPPAGTDGVFFGGGWGLFGEQVLAVVVVMAFSFAVSAVIGMVLKSLLPKGIRVSEDDEFTGLDLTQHSETGYSLEHV